MEAWSIRAEAWGGALAATGVPWPSYGQTNAKESSGARQCRREGARPELALRFDATRRPDSPPLARCYPGQENAIASDAFV